MRLTVYLTDGGVLNIEDFDPASALDLRDALGGDEWLTFDMDGATVCVNPANVVRLDFETA